VIEFPDSAALVAIAGDRRFLLAAAAAALSGMVRGFTGFGSALVFVPLVAAIYDPRIAAASLLLIDFTSGLPFAIQAAPRCDWHQVLPVAIAAAVGVPLGTMLLLLVDPVILRWILSVLVLAVVAVLASGWRYHGRPWLPATLAVGALSGIGGGAAQISGPPLMIYWLGGRSPAGVVRANMMMFLILNGAMLIVSYALQGVFTTAAVGLAILLAVPFVLAMILGARFFRGVSERLYRLVVYGTITASALASMPVFDRFLR
jgi:uncharacterized membrane protein YfcA